MSLDSRTADGVSPMQADDSARRSGLSAFLRSLLHSSGRERPRATAPDPLSDHVLQDIGLSRADLQALAL